MPHLGYSYIITAKELWEFEIIPATKDIDETRKEKDLKTQT